MKKKLSTAQRKVKKLLLDNEGSVIVGHRKITGTPCYRLVTFDHSPITNIRVQVLKNLYQYGIVIRVGSEYMINPEVKKKAAAKKQQPTDVADHQP